MATLIPIPVYQFLGDDGTPLAGGKIYTCDAGTSNPRETFQDADEVAPHTNPVILDAAGRAVIFWSGSYKVIIKDSNDNTIETIDNVQSYLTDLNLSSYMRTVLDDENAAAARATLGVVTATTSAEGLTELAADAEAVTGTSDSLVITPAALTARLAEPGEIGGTTPSNINATSLDLSEGSAPTTAAGEGSLYTKDSGTQPELFFREESSGDEVQITENGEVKQADRYLMDESGSAPSTAADQGAIYTKESDGQTELFFREESSGDEVQITEAGAVKLFDHSHDKGVLHFVELQSSGTAGGTFPQGAWQTRLLNFVQANGISGASVNTTTHQFTLPAGTYDVWFQAPAYNVGAHKLGLRNVTDSADVMFCQGYSATGAQQQTWARGQARLTIGGSKAFALWHYCQVTQATDGFGIASGAGAGEYYADVFVKKIDG